MTFAGLATAAVLLGLAGAAAVLRPSGGQATWLALHLALAGAAATAIASLMPFFTTALARVAPARPVARITGIVLIAGGALVVAGGVTWDGPALAVGGGMAYLVGLVVIAANAFLPLRSTLGLGLRFVPLAYGAALGCVAAGVALATAMLAGWQPVVADWAALKPAHAWLNVFGFLSVVIAATLIHLAPTVAGARIRPRRSASLALIGLASGAPVVALGFASGSDPAVRVGGALFFVGAVALVSHGFGVHRDRGRWTGDAGWHAFTDASLTIGPVWFLVGVGFAVWPLFGIGASASAWSVDRLAAPLALGWVAQILIGSWTHLVPAIGPGDQAVHARQRRRLGRYGVTRWLLWNAGVALVIVGGIVGSQILGTIGMGALAAGLLAALALLVGSVVIDPRPLPSPAAAPVVDP